MSRISVSIKTSFQVCFSVILINFCIAKEPQAFAQVTGEKECEAITDKLEDINKNPNGNLYLDESTISNLEKYNCSDTTEYEQALTEYKKKLEETGKELQEEHDFMLFYHVSYQSLIKLITEESVNINNIKFFKPVESPNTEVESHNTEKEKFYDYHLIKESEKAEIENLITGIKTSIKSIQLIIGEHQPDKDFFAEYLNNNKLKSLQIQYYTDIGVVRGLVNKGFDEEATEKLTEIIKENPTITIPDDLKFLHSRETVINSDLDFISNSYKGLLDLIGSLKYFLPGLIVFILLIRLAWRFILFLLRLFGRKWDIGLRQLLNSAYIGFRKFFNLPLPIEINNFEYGLSPKVPDKTLETILKSLLLKHALVGENILQSISDEPMGKFEAELNFARSLNLPLQLFWNLINVIIPKFSFEISGYLLKRQDKGFGLAITCKSYSNEKNTEIFWHKDYDPRWRLSHDDIDGLMRLLAEPISIWILFQLDKKAAAEWSGGDIWQIPAFTYSGIFWKTKGKIDNAQDLFTIASNYRKITSQGKQISEEKTQAMGRIAEFNLGVIKLQSIIDNEFKKCEELCNDCKESFNKARKGSLVYEKSALNLSSNERTNGNKKSTKKYEFSNNKFTRSTYKHQDSIWYKAKYQLAVIDIYQYLNETKNETKIDHLDRCMDKLILIIIAYNDTIKSIGNTSITQDITYIGNLSELLEYIAFLSSIMMASLFIHYANHGQNIQEKTKDRIRKIGWDRQTLNNPDMQDFLDEVIKKELKIDFSDFKPNNIYTFIENKLENHILEYIKFKFNSGDRKPQENKLKFILFTELHYSLACYYCDKYRLLLDKDPYSRDPDNTKKIKATRQMLVKHLEFALEHDKRKYYWLRIDPSLKTFRKEMRDEYLKITLKYSKVFQPIKK